MGFLIFTSLTIVILIAAASNNNKNKPERKHHKKVYKYDPTYDNEIEKRTFRKGTRIRLSGEVINGYSLSLAESAMLNGLTQEEKSKIINIVINNKYSHKGKNKLRQDLFDNFCKVDNYLFTDLVNAITVDEEKDIMYEWYRGFEKNLPNDCYTQQYPKVRELAKQNIIENDGFDDD